MWSEQTMAEAVGLRGHLEGAEELTRELTTFPAPGAADTDQGDPVGETVSELVAKIRAGITAVAPDFIEAVASGVVPQDPETALDAAARWAGSIATARSACEELLRLGKGGLQPRMRAAQRNAQRAGSLQATISGTQVVATARASKMSLNKVSTFLEHVLDELPYMVQRQPAAQASAHEPCRDLPPHIEAVGESLRQALEFWSEQADKQQTDWNGQEEAEWYTAGVLAIARTSTYISTLVERLMTYEGGERLAACASWLASPVTGKLPPEEAATAVAAFTEEVAEVCGAFRQGAECLRWWQEDEGFSAQWMEAMNTAVATGAGSDGTLASDAVTCWESWRAAVVSLTQACDGFVAAEPLLMEALEKAGVAAWTEPPARTDAPVVVPAVGLSERAAEVRQILNNKVRRPIDAPYPPNGWVPANQRVPDVEGRYDHGVTSKIQGDAYLYAQDANSLDEHAVIAIDGLVRYSDGRVVESGRWGWVIPEADQQRLFLFQDDSTMVLEQSADGAGEAFWTLLPRHWKEVQAMGFVKWSAIHHTSHIAEAPATGAGMLHIKDGRIVKITDESGHYRPTLADMQRSLKALGRCGFNLEGVEIEISGESMGIRGTAKREWLQFLKSRSEYVETTAIKTLAHFVAAYDEYQLRLHRATMRELEKNGTLRRAESEFHVARDKRKLWLSLHDVWRAEGVAPPPGTSRGLAWRPRQDPGSLYSGVGDEDTQRLPGYQDGFEPVTPRTQQNEEIEDELIVTESVPITPRSFPSTPREADQ
ncbi:hypothetical protein ACIQWN_38410 [Streptomyces vinaceus]|uniref:hypothetical protein n=1 Tax=Streptomyces vinaceus TaxID=1960 RepID=UPI0038065080